MKILVTYAIAQERVEVKFPNCEINYCQMGIGKVNAALSVYEAVNNFRPDVVLNVGTAGSVAHAVDSIVICSRFIDRDMVKCKDFGVDYEHHFHDEVKAIDLFRGWNIDNTCNTGDSFVTQVIADADAFDMENFAVAALCKRLNIPLVSVKYITDKIGENSPKHWEDKLEDAQKGLQSFFDGQIDKR